MNSFYLLFIYLILMSLAFGIQVLLCDFNCRNWFEIKLTLIHENGSPLWQNFTLDKPLTGRKDLVTEVWVHVTTPLLWACGMVRMSVMMGSVWWAWWPRRREEDEREREKRVWVPKSPLRACLQWPSFFDYNRILKFLPPPNSTIKWDHASNTWALEGI
jgi:hypothetical protein